MTQKERERFTALFAGIDATLKYEDETQGIVTARAVVSDALRELRGEAIAPNEVERRTRGYIEKIVEDGVTLTSLPDIMRGAQLNFMTHSEKIFAAHELQKHHFIRKQQRNFAGGAEWVYVRNKIRLAPGGAAIAGPAAR